jgi:hypothetical protein
MSQMPREKAEWKTVVRVAPVVDDKSSWASASLLRLLSARGSLKSQDFPPFTLDTRITDQADKQCLHGGSDYSDIGDYEGATASCTSPA